MSQYPAFTAYALTTVVLVLNLIVLWGYSGALRNKSGIVNNPEDAARFNKTFAAEDPPQVARVLRAHANAQATIFPFLFLGLVFLLAGGAATTAWVLFGLFTLARIAHSVAYLCGIQPWRTILFAVSVLAMLVLLLDILRLIA